MLTMNSSFAALALRFALVFGLAEAAAGGQFRLLVLHNNDLHARFVETDVYCSSCPAEYSKEGKCFGGFARQKRAIDAAAAEARAKNISSIILNAGDTFQGTPYYTLYKGEIVAPLLDSLGANVTCLGNHEFDDGIDTVVDFLKRVKTPVVVCNLNLTSEPRMKLPNLKPSIVLEVDGRKIGVVGYLTPDTMSISNPEKLQILDEIPAIRAEAQRLKKQGVNIIIALGHSGFQRDIEIAEQVSEISMVVGGHSHTLLYTPKDRPPSVERADESYPYMVTRDSGQVVPVVQAYAFSKYLGKVWVTFDDNGDVVSAEGGPQLLDSSVSQDPTVQKEVDNWSRRVQDRVVQVQGYTRSFIDKANFARGQYESTGGNLMTDALRDLAIRRNNGTSQDWTDTPIAVAVHGALRSRINNKKNGGAVTIEDILMFAPFETPMYRIRYPGSTLEKAIEKSVAQENTNYFPYFLIYSGMKVVYNMAKPIGQRVESIQVICKTCSMPRYEPLQPEKMYTVVLNEFVYHGGDKFDVFQKDFSNVTKLGFTDTDALMAYFENHRVVYPILEDRIIVKGLADKTASSASISSVSMVSVFVSVLAAIVSLHMVL